MIIRKYLQSDWLALWPIIEKVFRQGESYTFSPEISESESHKNWIEVPTETYVAVSEDDKVIGTFYIKPNQAELGSHVCNCGYIVSENARGEGVASKMCEYSQKVALEMGFTAMQYNFVVATNTAAIHLWEKLGFRVVGKLPSAFNSPSCGYVDALIMFKEL